MPQPLSSGRDKLHEWVDYAVVLNNERKLLGISATATFHAEDSTR